MLNSMDAGVSGLKSHGKALSVTADNIANVSTMGYKANRANFGDLMVRSLTVGGSVVNQVGVGSRVLNVQQMMLQGSLETTELPTDLAITGSGFFKVRNPVVMDTFTGNSKYDVNGKLLNANTGPSYYTRAGQFIVDPEGYLTNPMGLRLQGYNVDIRGNLNLFPEDLQLLTQQVDAIPTSEWNLTMNLNAEDDRYHPPSQAVDPADSSTFNHMSTVRTYDALGVAHDLVIFYQRLDRGAYTGPQIAGSEHVWKAVVMEKDGDTYHQNNMTDGYTGTFYLHFDDVGHLVGNTTGQPAAGDAYRTVNAQKIGEISERAGEIFSYNTDPDNNSANNHTFRTYMSVNLTEWNAAGDSININGIIYKYEDYPTGATLAAAINRTAGNNGVFCDIDSGNNLRIYTSGNTTAGITFTNDGMGNDLAAVGVTSSQMMQTINGDTTSDYAKARGCLVMSGNNPAVAGSIVLRSPDGVTPPVTLTVPVATTDSLTTIRTNLQAALDGQYGASTFVVVDIPDATGGSIYIQSNTAGDEYNLSMRFSDGMGITGTSTMVGGFTADPNVKMSQDSNGNINIQRMDQGVTAILNIDPGNTIAHGKFSMTQTSYAMDQEEPYTTNSDEVGAARKGVRMMSFDWLAPVGAHEPQEILINYIPNINSPTTQSAGTNDNMYNYQDGSPRGTLESLDISKDGLITGNFNNGTVKLLGAVLLYNVQTPEALKREGENLWSVTSACGAEIWGRPGQGNLGSVQSGALEKSNVDLAEEMVDMINFQRAFQANSKTIQTTDQLLQELIQLKR